MDIWAEFPWSTRSFSRAQPCGGRWLDYASDVSLKEILESMSEEVDNLLWLQEPWMAQVPEKVTSIAAGHQHTLCLGGANS